MTNLVLTSGKKFSSNLIEKRCIGDLQMTYKIIKTCPAIFKTSVPFLGLTGAVTGISGKESACQYRRLGRYRFNPWVRKMPWRRKWPPISVSCLGFPRTGQSSRLQPMGLQRVGHD